MAESKEQTFELLPEWSIRQYGNTLVITGGADAKYEVELETSDPSFFPSVPHNSQFTRSQLPKRDQRVLEELIVAEIVIPTVTKNQPQRVALLGDAGTFALPRSKSIVSVQTHQVYDMALVIRENATYAGLLEGIHYQDIDKPHLLVDIAFHHTVSLGPLVFPGETACIACLQGRITKRWGDETPPPSPKVRTDYPTLISEFVAAETERIARGDTSLTNKTMSWNLQERVITKRQLLKVPLCPVCTGNEVDRSGALPLP